jgi:hypothetical protein
MQDLASFAPRRNRPDRPAAALLHRSQNLMLHPGRQPFQSISIFNQDQAVAASAGTPTPPAADRISGRTGMAGLHREIRARPRNSRLLAPPVTACLDATRRVPMHIGLFLSGGWPARVTDDEERSDDGLQVPDRVVTVYTESLPCCTLPPNPYEISPLAICSPVDLSLCVGRVATPRPTVVPPHRSRRAKPLGTFFALKHDRDPARWHIAGCGLSTAGQSQTTPCLAVGGPLAAPGAYSLWRLKRCRSAARARQRLNPCTCDVRHVLGGSGGLKRNRHRQRHTPRFGLPLEFSRTELVRWHWHRHPILGRTSSLHDLRCPC